MATRKIKDAKDLTTNELIYFKGHAKATYMSDGRTVEDAIDEIQNGGSTATNTHIELDPNTTTFYLENGTYILKCNSGKNYSFRLQYDGTCRIIMGVTSGSTYGTIDFYHSLGSIIWVNNNEPVFEDNKMIEISFESLMTGIGFYSALGTWASYDATFESEGSVFPF